jgi:hypothetical protein
MKTRPLAYLTFALNYFVHGFDLTGYHVVNIVIHIVTAILLFCFVSMTLSLAYGGESSDYFLVSFAAALLWLVHPVQVQSVTYIVQRMNSLSVMFYMLSVVLYVQARRTDSRPVFILLFFGVFLSGLSALGSKEIAITLPVILYAYEICFISKKKINATKNICVVLLIIVLAAAAAYLFLGPNPLDRVLAGY